MRTISLTFVAKSLRNDREIVLAAVRSDGSALAYAPDALRADRKIVREAVKQTKDGVQYASVDLLAQCVLEEM